MKEAWRAADCAAELRAAARGWLAAGLVGEATFEEIAAGIPASGPRLGPTWRVLVFMCVSVGVAAATTITFVSFGLRSGLGVGLTLLLSGLALAVVTDIVVDRCAFQSTGAEAATSLLAAAYLGAAAYVFLDDHFKLSGSQALRLTQAWCAALFALASWRWGFRLYAGAAVLFALALAAQVPGARLSWTLVAALVVVGATASLDRGGLAPSHRGAVETARVVALAALYAAVNYYSVETGFLEGLFRFGGGPRPRTGGGGLLLAGAASALYPLGLLAWGLKSRDRVLLDLGILAAALSLTTIRFYVHVAPLWVVLAGSGAALAGASLLLERGLRAGRDGERFGFTAAPLYDEGRRERLLPVAAALAMAPAARIIPDDRPGVTGQGGAFGGGGSDETF